MCIAINLLLSTQRMQSTPKYSVKIFSFVDLLISCWLIFITQLIFWISIYNGVLVGLVDCDWGSSQTDLKRLTGYIFSIIVNVASPSCSFFFLLNAIYTFEHLYKIFHRT